MNEGSQDLDKDVKESMEALQAPSSQQTQPVSPTCTEESTLRAALDSIVYDSLRLATLGLAILYLVFAVSHPFVLPIASAIPLTFVAVVSAIVFCLGFLRLGQGSIPTHLAQPIAVGICSLVLANAFLHLFLVPEPQQTTGFMLIVIGVGLFLLSVRWLICVLAVTWIGWGALVWLGPPAQGWTHFGFALFIATVLAVMVHMARLRTYRRLEHARLQGERDKDELVKAMQVVQQSEERYRELVENSTDALASFTLEGTIFQANLEAELLWGYSRAEALGQPFSKFITPASTALAQERILRSLSGEEVPPLFELECVRKDGSIVPVEGRSRFIRDAENMPIGIQAAFRDIADRKQAEEQQRRYVERLGILREIDRAIQMAQSPEAIAQAALLRLRQLIPCRRASVSLMDFSARESLLLAVDMTGETYFPAGMRLPFSSLTIVDVDAFRQGQIVEVEDLLALADPPPMGQGLRMEGIRAHLHVPLTALGETIGSLSLAKETPGAFAAEHREIAQEVANSLAIALQQSRLHAQVRRQAEELERKVLERTAELRAAEEEYRAIFEHASIGIYRSSLDGHQLRANPALVKLNGYASEEEMLPAINDIATQWYVDPNRREEFAASSGRARTRDKL